MYGADSKRDMACMENVDMMCNEILGCQWSEEGNILENRKRSNVLEELFVSGEKRGSGRIQPALSYCSSLRLLYSTILYVSPGQSTHKHTQIYPTNRTLHGSPRPLTRNTILHLATRHRAANCTHSWAVITNGIIYTSSALFTILTVFYTFCFSLICISFKILWK